MKHEEETGPFRVRKMPLRLRVKLKILAASRNTTMEQLVIDICAEYVSKHTHNGSAE